MEDDVAPKMVKCRKLVFMVKFQYNCRTVKKCKIVGIVDT